LGDGSQFGINLSYATQPKPEGLAQAFIIGEEFLAGDSCLMILGDNIFHGAGLGHQLQETLPSSGAHIFTYAVSDPYQYGVLNIDDGGNPVSIEEKPTDPTSNLAVTGLYFFDNQVSGIAKKVTPSARGELEITSVIESYLRQDALTVTQLSRGAAWLDTGSPSGLHDAASYVRVIEERTGLKIGCLEEISFRNNWISFDDLETRAKVLGNNSYSQYLTQITQ
jgi:glucose-1-phosphate thymidylyltransferase